MTTVNNGMTLILPIPIYPTLPKPTLLHPTLPPGDRRYVSGE